MIRELSKVVEQVIGLSGKNVPGKGDSKCKGPEDQVCSTCVISTHEARGEG